MSGFENYSREALQIEHEIETTGEIFGVNQGDHSLPFKGEGWGGDGGGDGG